MKRHEFLVGLGATMLAGRTINSARSARFNKKVPAEFVKQY
jgi:hypothetical protein